MKIRIEYDGAHPNLCLGILTVILDDNRYELGSVLVFGGGEYCEKYDILTNGVWSVNWYRSKYKFTPEIRSAIETAVNEEIDDKPCCGGCI